MTTISKNHAAILILALSKLVSDDEIYEFCFRYRLDPAECYKNATEIVSPSKLLAALDSAEKEILEKARSGLKILTLFDYGDSVKNSFIYCAGDTELLNSKKFTVNLSRASNVLALRVEEVLERLAEKAPASLAMVGGASSSFASSVRYHECGKPVIMTVEDDTFNNFKNNFASLTVYGVRASSLYPVALTFDLVTRKGATQTIADVAGNFVNISTLGVERATDKILNLIDRAEA